MPRNGNKLEGKYKWGTKCNKIQLEKNVSCTYPIGIGRGVDCIREQQHDDTKIVKKIIDEGK